MVAWTVLADISTQLEALDDDALYGDHYGEIVRIPKKGGKHEVLARSPHVAYGEQLLAIDATHVYYSAIEESDGGPIPRGLFRVAKTGGPVSKLCALDFDPEGIAVDDTRVYLTHRYDMEKLRGIYAVPKAGGKLTTLVQSRSAGKIFVDAKNLTWASYDAAGIVFEGTVERMPKAGGAITKTLPRGPAPFSMIPFGKGFVTGHCRDTKSSAKPGCGVSFRAGAADEGLYGGSESMCFGVGGEQVLVIDKGSVLSIVPGSPNRTLATGVPECRHRNALADENYVYWSTPKEVIKLPR